ncbi:MAG: RidA family protein [Phycisphaerales bacterium]
MERTNVSTGTVWEERVGYCRVVRVGPFVYAAGTLCTDDDGEMVHPHSAYLQTLGALEKIERSMKKAGASRADVVRTRMYILHLRDQEDVGRAHKEFFGQVLPVSTMIEVKGLAAPTALVEIEVDAVLAGGA